MQLNTATARLSLAVASLLTAAGSPAGAAEIPESGNWTDGPARNRIEIGVLSYDVYWEEPTRRFTHLITYLDDVADEIHRNEPHLIEFVTKMHPLGEIDPKPTIIATLRGHVPSGAVLFASTKQLNDKEGERES